jgi:hypothetical protein
MALTTPMLVSSMLAGSSASHLGGIAAVVGGWHRASVLRVLAACGVAQHHALSLTADGRLMGTTHTLGRDGGWATADCLSSGEGRSEAVGELISRRACPLMGWCCVCQWGHYHVPCAHWNHQIQHRRSISGCMNLLQQFYLDLIGWPPCPPTSAAAGTPLARSHPPDLAIQLQCRPSSSRTRPWLTR